MNAIEMLKEQHEEARELLELLARENDTHARGELLKKTAGMLTKHTILEETHFYGSVCQRGLEELTHQARHEHEEAKLLLEALGKLDAADSRFAQLATQLKDAVFRHMHEEETVLFPRAQTQCDFDTLDHIGDAMQTSSRVWESNEPAVGA